MSEFSLNPITPARPAILPHLVAVALTGLFSLLSALGALVLSLS